MPKGVFTISLDFELFWGVRDHRTLENYGSNIRNVHSVVPRLLELFEKYGVHCTWATVGFLFLKNKQEIIENLPALFPDYLLKEYDPYAYIKHEELEPVYHFAPHLIEQITRTPGQEIGTHTFSHFYSLERNTRIEEFKEDIVSAIKVAEKNNIKIRSIVFPRNQYAAEHIETCRQQGIKVYRGNEASGVYRPVSRENESIFRRALRFADTFINITGHHCHPLPVASDIINVPASRFLRPFNPRFRILDPLKFKRITKSLQYAASHGLIYHLWWHPHNFGRYMNENFKFLENILKVYQGLYQKQEMESLNLYEFFSKTMQTVHEN